MTADEARLVESGDDRTGTAAMRDRPVHIGCARQTPDLVDLR